MIELRDLNKAYELKIETQDNAINTMQESYELQGEALNALSQKNHEIEAEMSRYLGDCIIRMANRIKAMLR